jgi:hypothetical protein
MVMSKRANFKRRKNDAYLTWDKNALPPLLPHLKPKTRFCEPCAGAGHLIDQLQSAGHFCVDAWDLEPQRADITQLDALKMSFDAGFEYFITNPPWTRSILHPMIEHLSSQLPTWLLFDADWMHNLSSGKFLKHCVKIVSTPRLKWIEGTDQAGKDNCAWYLFDINHESYPTMLGRSSYENQPDLFVAEK